MRTYNDPNKFFILDASIDRAHRDLLPFLSQHKIPFIVLRLKVSPSKVVERITKREGNNKEIFLERLPKWMMDYENFGKTYKDPVYILENEEEGLVSLEGIFELINKYRGQSQPSVHKTLEISPSCVIFDCGALYIFGDIMNSYIDFSGL